MDSIDRILPHSNDAEQAVLGSIIISNECFNDVVQIITAEDFYQPVHADIFRLMQRFSLQNKPLDVIPFIAALVDDGIYEDEAAARSYIKLLVDVVPKYVPTAHADLYILIFFGVFLRLTQSVGVKYVDVYRVPVSF